MLLTTNDALDEACAVFAQEPFITIDTEFLRETTYYPRLCLIQMACPDKAVLIDPLSEELDLAPFLALMRNENIVKVFHAARQDIEILWNLSGEIPAPLFDTQVAAMVCGYGDSVSYEQLAQDYARAKIDKSSRFTDWSRRPLSDAQRVYARADVTHLVTIYQRMREEIETTGRLTWLEEEMAILTSPDTYRADPDQAWRRLVGRIRKPRELAVLQEIAAWRESEAKSRDVPRGRVMKDEALIEITVSQPRDGGMLARLRAVPSGFDRSRFAEDVLEAVSRGLARDLATLPSLERPRGRARHAAVLDMLKVLLKLVCDRERVAPKLVASSEDLDDLAAYDETMTQDDNAVLRGWRREVFGEKALDLMAGRLALGLSQREVVLVPQDVLPAVGEA
jgi:ribonuclease D